MAGLCDVNILVAAVSKRHQHHTKALAWFQGVGEGEAIICRVAQLGLIRLLNNPAVMREDVLNASQCWTLWHQMLSDSRWSFVAAEPQNLDFHLEAPSTGTGHSPGIWTDSYLAAFARASDFSLVTLDRGFSRFPGLRVQLLH